MKFASDVYSGCPKEHHTRSRIHTHHSSSLVISVISVISVSYVVYILNSGSLSFDSFAESAKAMVSDEHGRGADG